MRYNLFTSLAAATAKGIVVVAAWFFCLEFLAVRYRLPHADAVLTAFISLIAEGQLFHDLSVSMSRWFIGWVVGACVGIAFGLLTGRNPFLRWFAEPPINFFKAAPFITLIPLSLRVFGLAEIGKFFLIGWISATVSWLIVHQAVLKMPEKLVWLWKSAGASSVSWILFVLIPHNWRHLASSLRASASLALIVVAAVEMGGVYERSSGYWWSEGLGYRVFRALDVGRDDTMLACITVFSAVGLLLDRCVVLTTRLIGTACSHASKRWSRRKASLLGRNAATLEKTKAGSPSSHGTVSVRVEGAGYGASIVISKLQLRIEEGHTLVVLGPSGCGKTTLLQAIAKVASRGFWSRSEISLNGAEHRELPASDIGVVFQDCSVFDHLTVIENVLLGLGSKNDEQNAWRLLTEFQIEKYATQRAAQLSGGERQRLAIAMALGHDPKILLFDEPFGSLDSITRRTMQRFFVEQVHGRIPCLFVTHSLDEAILLGNVVRVGISDGSEVEIDRHGQSFDAFESSEVCLHYRRILLQRIEHLGVRPNSPCVTQSQSATAGDHKTLK